MTQKPHSRKAQILELVTENVSDLQMMTVAELFNWGKLRDINDGKAFAAFKRALAQHGINYEERRQNERDARAAAIAKLQAISLTLYTHARGDQFAIVSDERRLLARGHHHGGLTDISLPARAIAIAGRIRKVQGADVIHLKLYLSTAWAEGLYNAGLKELYHGHMTGRFRDLHEIAKHCSVMLEFQIVHQSDNPAASYTIETTPTDWEDPDLRSFGTRIDPV